MKSPKEVLLDAIGRGELDLIELCRDAILLCSDSSSKNRGELLHFKQLLRDNGISQPYNNRIIAINTIQELATQSLVDIRDKELDKIYAIYKNKRF